MTRTLLLARHVYTGDPPRPSADALILDGERVEWTGSRDALPGRAPRRRIDLGEASIVPGFVDAHVHLSIMALLPGWTDLSDTRSVGEIVTRLRRAARAVPAGGWIVGWGVHEPLVGRGRRLVREQLDMVSPDRPVLVAHRSLHSGVASSAALAAVGFGRETPRWPGGELERDIRGEPNGRAWDRAYSVLEAAARRAEADTLGSTWSQRAHARVRALVAAGVTSICDAAVDPADLTRLVVAELPIDVVAMPVGARSWFATPHGALGGPKTGEVMANVRVGPLKLFADGAERCAMRIPLGTAGRALRGVAGSGEAGGRLDALRMLRPRVAPGALRTGTLYYERDELRAVVRGASARGFSVAIHALGNEALRFALDALEPAAGGGHRMEHAVFAEPSEMERMARLGVHAVVQPGHLAAYGDLIRTAGVEDTLPPVPVRGLLDAGVAVAFSSDAPTAAADPLRTIPVAVHRTTPEGHALAPGQGISAEEALRAATLGAAHAAGFDDRGILAPGYRADLAVLSGDPFDAGTDVIATWVAGRRLHPEGSPD